MTDGPQNKNAEMHPAWPALVLHAVCTLLKHSANNLLTLSDRAGKSLNDSALHAGGCHDGLIMLG